MDAADAYAATASAYDLFVLPYRAAQRAALERLIPHLIPAAGPVLDVGAGSGANAAFILERVPEARVLALEPSDAMRALAISRVAEHPEWFPRITVRHEGFLEASLPDRLGGALLLGVLGHFDPGERGAVLAELAARIPRGGGVLVDLQPPDSPRRVEPYEFTAATLGDVTYRGIAEAWPIDDETMRWRMSYITLEGELVLTERTADYHYRHPRPERLVREAEELGFTAERLDDPSFWLLLRR